MKTLANVKLHTKRVRNRRHGETGGPILWLAAAWGTGDGGHQTRSQMMPHSPTIRKAALQPLLRMIQATTGGARIAPTEEPLLKMPEASARSRSGNHSATTLTPAGQFPASPMPS